MSGADPHDLFDAGETLVLLPVTDFDSGNFQSMLFEDRLHAHREVLLRHDDGSHGRLRDQSTKLTDRAIADDDVVGAITQLDALTTKNNQAIVPSWATMCSVMEASDRPFVDTLNVASDS